MRPIVSNISTPTEKLALWLINELNRLEPPVGMYVKNTIDFVNRIKDVKVAEDEIMVSFDITALYPNVPVDVAIQCLVDHAKHLGVEDTIVEVYKRVTEVCMDQSYFQFRGRFFKQTYGTCMGSKIAPYLSNIFMCHFEKIVSQSPRFPRIWWRYVDDVFAIVKKQDLEATLLLLNSQYNTIKFTFEQEDDGNLPFLDVRVIRTGEHLKFGIYRKVTNTMRFITSDSHHNSSHKKAAFHSLAHRLHTIPLSEEEFRKEEEYIKESARINGYGTRFVQSILNKHKRKQQIHTLTTLSNISESETKDRVCVPFYPKITNKLGKLLKRFNIELVTKSTTLGSFICQYKDKIPSASKSGIYKICCSNCEEVYIGQTARSFEKRFQEHINATKNKQPLKSSVADHFLRNPDHQIDFANSKLIKTVNERWKLDAFESLWMDKHKFCLMNNEDSPIASNLFNAVNSLTSP